MTASYVPYHYSWRVWECEDCERMLHLTAIKPATFGSGVMRCTPGPLRTPKILVVYMAKDLRVKTINFNTALQDPRFIFFINLYFLKKDLIQINLNENKAF